MNCSCGKNKATYVIRDQFGNPADTFNMFYCLDCAKKYIFDDQCDWFDGECDKETTIEVRGNDGTGVPFHFCDEHKDTWQEYHAYDCHAVPCPQRKFGPVEASLFELGKKAKEEADTKAVYAMDRNKLSTAILVAALILECDPIHLTPEQIRSVSEKTDHINIDWPTKLEDMEGFVKKNIGKLT